MNFAIHRAIMRYTGDDLTYPSDKWVLVALADCAGANDITVWPGVAYLCRMTLYKERQVRLSLKRLECSGFIKAEQGRKEHLNHYTFNVEKLAVRESDNRLTPMRKPQRQAEREAPAPPPTPQDSPAESLVEKYFPQLKEGYEPPPPPRSIVAMSGGTALAPIVLEGEPVPEERGRVALPQIAPLQPLADLTEARAMAQKTTLPEYQKWRRCQGVSALKAMNEYQRFNERIDG